MIENAKKTEEKKEEIPKDAKELTIAQLDILPSDKKISVGSIGEFTKDELIERVEKGDEIGRKVVEIELNFLRTLREGSLLRDILAPDQEQELNE